MSTKETPLWELLERGGIYYSLNGNSIQEVLNELVKIIKAGEPIHREELLTAILEREALMSTSIGKAIAIPHPRNPIISLEEDQFTAMAFLGNPVDWNALDGQKVDTLILTLSASAKSHLKTLSAISFFCRQEDFIKLLKERASREAIISYIKDTEQTWK